MVLTAFEGSDSPWPGDRIPYAPPFGVVFAAWGHEEERRAWIQRAASASTALAQRLDEILDGTRERGFDVDYASLAMARAASLVDTLDSGAIALPPSIRGTPDQLRVEVATMGFPDDAATAGPALAGCACARPRAATPVPIRKLRRVCGCRSRVGVGSRSSMRR